ncbi:MAG TPA: hypothetical protein VGN12_23215 [Pirellulales bacterium]|jgi:hypothetical protein
MNHHRRRIYVASAALLACLLLGGIFSWAMLQNRFTSRIAAVKARGEPLTYAELGAIYPHPPADQDTTDLLIQAGEALAASAKDAAWRPLPFISEGREPPQVGQPWAELALAEKFLTDNATSVRQLHEAAALGCLARFPGVTTPDAVGAVLNYASPLRCAARVLRLESNVRAHSGDAQGAIEAVTAGLTLQRSLANEPLIISQLVRLAMFGSAAHELKSTLGSIPYSDDALARVHDILAGIDFHRGLRPAFMGERVFGLATLENISSAHPRATNILMKITSAPDKSRYLDVVNDYLDATEKPWPDMLSDSTLIELKYQGNNSHWHVLSGGIGPTFMAAINAVSRAELVRRLALVAVAVEQYHHRHGVYPADLAQLVPEFLSEVPLDPTDGQSFHYRTENGSYDLYSTTDAFPLPSGESVDLTTGANPSFLFRMPSRRNHPLPNNPIKKSAADRHTKTWAADGH